MASSVLPKTLGNACLSPHLFSINGDTADDVPVNDMMQRQSEFPRTVLGAIVTIIKDVPLGQKIFDRPSSFIGAISLN